MKASPAFCMTGRTVVEPLMTSWPAMAGLATARLRTVAAKILLKDIVILLQSFTEKFGSSCALRCKPGLLHAAQDSLCNVTVV